MSPPPPPPSKPLELYMFHLSPPSRAVLVTAQHLSLPVITNEVDIFAGETRTPEYAARNPTKTVPTLVDGPVTLFESRAIMAYLVNRYDGADSLLYPAEPVARAQVDKILYFDASGYFPALRACFIPILVKKQSPTQETVDTLSEKLGQLVTLLDGRDFFTGKHVTIADLSIATSVPFVKQLFPALWPDPLEQWYERVVRKVPQVKESNDTVELL